MNPPVDVVIERVRELHAADLEELLAESTRAGWRHLARLRDDWLSSKNRFDRPGEGLFLARLQARAIGVCGLNIDPFGQDPAIGRLRRLYVLTKYRRSGVGRALARHVIQEAEPWFREVRLYTGDTAADTFYRGLGFRRVVDVRDCSHVLQLPPPPSALVTER